MKKIKLSTRIIGINIFYILIIIGISLFAIFKANNIDTELRGVAHQDLPLTIKFTKIIEEQLNQSALYEKSFYLHEKKMKYELLQNEEQFKELCKNIDNEIKSAIFFINGVISNENESETTKEFKILVEKVQLLSKEQSEYEQKVSSLFALMNDASEQSFNEKKIEIDKSEEILDEHSKSIVESIENFTSNSALQAETDLKHLFRAIIIIGFIAVTLGLTLGLFVSISTNRELNSVVKSITGGMKELHNITKQVAASSSILADEANSQAASLEETTAAVENIAAFAQKNKEHTNSSFELVKSIKNELAEIKQIINNFSDFSQNISGELQYISDKLESYGNFNVQLNMLALNSSVEADRNNTTGVKAYTNEIRDIAKLNYGSLQEISGKTIGLLRLVNNQSETFNKISSGFNVLIPDLDKLNEISGKISASISEQSNSLSEISISGQSLNQVTSEVAVSSEENAQLAKTMKTISDSLNTVILKLAQIAGITAIPVIAALADNFESQDVQNNENNTETVEAEHPDMLF